MTKDELQLLMVLINKFKILVEAEIEVKTKCFKLQNILTRHKHKKKKGGKQ